MNETPDQARTRRRWISLAEIATIAGLLIGAGGLYLNWQDRREDQAEKASAANARVLPAMNSPPHQRGRASAVPAIASRSRAISSW